ncbi:hypothetical protein SteCoe_14569 [Stentor coeruleus]|uniref:PARP catalytic domain-containing protein n=1 Tax=Stentor coeruleus TaxID=5963 RepID=A0A1R2C5N7_9CILI|nr:hypothetical protein SteCoe_14569 [Stentor coeruleus]
MNNRRTNCGNCQRVFPQMNIGSKYICQCSAEICSICGYTFHNDYTCFYYLTQCDFQIIDLQQQVSDPSLHAILQYYLNQVRVLFESGKGGGNLRFVRAQAIVNKPLEVRYAAKKACMAGQCGGRERVNEVFLWHGSAESNYNPIARDGLKVAGVDLPPGGQGYGLGIYSGNATTASGHTKGSKWLLLFQGMKGNNSPSTITTIPQLNNGQTHSFTAGDITVFFTKEQILPRYLIEFSN